jgi:hypothetical protein
LVFQPIVVFDGEGRLVTAMLRPGKRPSGPEIRAFVRRLVGEVQPRLMLGRDLRRRGHRRHRKPRLGYASLMQIVRR